MKLCIQADSGYILKNGVITGHPSIRICWGIGHWVMVRDWGSLDTKLGGTKTELLEGFGQGKAQLEAVGKRRANHRYRLVEADGVGLGVC